MALIHGSNKSNGKLTAKQRLFCEEYLVDYHGTRAAIAAGYAEASAHAEASRMLRYVKIKSYINKRLDELMEKTQITQERVLAEYAKIAFVDPRKFYDSTGNLVPIPLLDGDAAATLQSFEVTQEVGSDGMPAGITKKIKLCDKIRALDSLARHLGMFVDKTEVKSIVESMSDEEIEAKIKAAQDEINK